MSNDICYLQTVITGGPAFNWRLLCYLCQRHQIWHPNWVKLAPKWNKSEIFSDQIQNILAHHLTHVGAKSGNRGLDISLEVSFLIFSGTTCATAGVEVSTGASDRLGGSVVKLSKHFIGVTSPLVHSNKPPRRTWWQYNVAPNPHIFWGPFIYPPFGVTPGSNLFNPFRPFPSIRGMRWLNLPTQRPYQKDILAGPRNV